MAIFKGQDTVKILMEKKEDPKAQQMAKIKDWTLQSIHDTFDSWNDGRFVPASSQEFNDFKNILGYSYLYNRKGCRHDLCFNTERWFLVRAREKSD